MQNSIKRTFATSAALAVCSLQALAQGPEPEPKALRALVFENPDGSGGNLAVFAADNPGPEQKTAIVDSPGIRFGGADLSTAEKQVAPQTYLGIETSEVPAALAAQTGLQPGFGLLTEQVIPDSPAAAAGLQRYDILKKLNDQLLVSPSQLSTLVRAESKGAKVTLTIIRKGAEQTITAELGEKALPLSQNAASPVPNYWIREMDRIPEVIETETKKLGETARMLNEKVEAKRKALENDQRKLSEQLQAEASKAIQQNAPILRWKSKPDAEDDRKYRIVTKNAVTTLDGSQMNLMLADGAGTIEITSNNGKRNLKFTDPSGQVIFSGPIDTEEQWKQVPEIVRHKIESMDGLKYEPEFENKEKAEEKPENNK